MLPWLRHWRSSRWQGFGRLCDGPPLGLATLRRRPQTVGPAIAGKRAGVAQLAEQLICNQQVVGSIPSASSTRNPL